MPHGGGRSGRGVWAAAGHAVGPCIELGGLRGRENRGARTNAPLSARRERAVARLRLPGTCAIVSSLLVVGWVLWLAITLIKHPTDRKVIVNASVVLLRSIGGEKLKSVQDYFDRVRESPQFKRDAERLGQWQKRSKD